MVDKTKFAEAAEMMYTDWVKTGKSLGSGRFFGFCKKGVSIMLLIILVLVLINVVIGAAIFFGH